MRIGLNCCYTLYSKCIPFLSIAVSPLGPQDGSAGHIESAFGKAGRFKAHFPPGTSVKVRTFGLEYVSHCHGIASSLVVWSNLVLHKFRALVPLFSSYIGR